MPTYHVTPTATGCGAESFQAKQGQCAISTNLNISGTPCLRALLNWAQPASSAAVSADGSKLKDWLTLHRFEVHHFWQLQDWLDTHPRAPLKRHAVKAGKLIPQNQAWEICCAAFQSSFPSLKKYAAQVHRYCEKCLTPCRKKHPAAFVYNFETDTYPLISTHYSGRPIDLLVLSHEFGHATQIVTSRHASRSSEALQMPPSYREICAFLSELALLNYARNTDEALYQELLVSWHHDNEQYLNRDLLCLLENYDKHDAPYDYRWNYPMARLWAIHAWNNWSNENVAGLYANDAGEKQALAAVRFKDIELEKISCRPEPQIRRDVLHA
jgi:hypothetical protein